MALTMQLAAAFAREAGAEYDEEKGAFIFSVPALQRYTCAIAGAALLDQEGLLPPIENPTEH